MMTLEEMVACGKIRPIRTDEFDARHQAMMCELLKPFSEQIDAMLDSRFGGVLATFSTDPAHPSIELKPIPIDEMRL